MQNFQYIPQKGPQRTQPFGGGDWHDWKGKYGKNSAGQPVPGQTFPEPPPAASGGGFLKGLGDEYLNSNPSAAFASVFGNFLGRNNPLSSFVRSKQGDYLDLYSAAVAQDPTLRYLNFLGGMNPLDEFNALAPSQRGERPAPQVTYKTLFGF